MTVQDEPRHDERLHQLVHDVQNCLHVIGMGMELQKDARGDDARYAELGEAMSKQHKKAVRLLDDYIRAAYDRPA